MCIRNTEKQLERSLIFSTILVWKGDIFPCHNSVITHILTRMDFRVNKYSFYMYYIPLKVIGLISCKIVLIFREMCKSACSLQSRLSCLAYLSFLHWLFCSYEIYSLIRPIIRRFCRKYEAIWIKTIVSSLFVMYFCVLECEIAIFHGLVIVCPDFRLPCIRFVPEKV